MSKQEQLAEFITQDIVAFIMEDDNIDMITAMHRFYSSVTYEKLMEPETGLYRESSSYVYSMFCDESRIGTLTNQ